METLTVCSEDMEVEAVLASIELMRDVLAVVEDYGNQLAHISP